jgi:SAM-dependent methyltransferase
VVADVARLPFARESFDGAVSLHTIHHLPQGEHRHAYREVYRVLCPGKRAVVVDGWDNPPLMRPFNGLIRLRKKLLASARRLRGREAPGGKAREANFDPAPGEPKGTFVSKKDAARLRREIGTEIPCEILVWRSVSVRFTRAFVHPQFGGRVFLRLLFWLEERFPHFFGENGQYPLIVVRKV